MKRYLPDKTIILPRWFELFIIPILWTVLFLTVCFYKEINNSIEHNQAIINNNAFILVSIIIYVVFIFLKLYKTSTIVDEIEFTDQNKIIFKYSKFYLIKKTIEIGYNEFSFKYYDTLGLKDSLFTWYKGSDGGYYDYLSVKIYKNDIKIIKLVSKNGWRKTLVDEIIEEFQKISPTEKSNSHF